MLRPGAFFMPPSFKGTDAKRQVEKLLPGRAQRQVPATEVPCSIACVLPADSRSRRR